MIFGHKHHINMRFQFTLYDDEQKNALARYVFHFHTMTTNDSLIRFNLSRPSRKKKRFNLL